MDFNIDSLVLKTQAVGMAILGFGELTKISAASWVGLVFALPGALYYSVKFYKDFIRKK